MRLFVGIDIDEAIRQRIASFLESLREAAPKARWTKPETFHITLKFIGETALAREILEALRSVQRPSPKIEFRGTGFFPSPRSARVFWIGMETDDRLSALAMGVDDAVAGLGFPKETRAFKPHLTLARASERASGNPHLGTGSRVFAGLQKRLETVPSRDFGTMQAQEFFLYESKLSPAGARYIKVAGFPLT